MCLLSRMFPDPSPPPYPPVKTKRCEAIGEGLKAHFARRDEKRNNEKYLFLLMISFIPILPTIVVIVSCTGARADITRCREGGKNDFVSPTAAVRGIRLRGASTTTARNKSVFNQLSNDG